MNPFTAATEAVGVAVQEEQAAASYSSQTGKRLSSSYSIIGVILFYRLIKLTFATHEILLRLLLLLFLLPRKKYFTTKFITHTQVLRYEENE